MFCQLQFGVDESYELKVPDPEAPNYAYLKVCITKFWFLLISF